MASIRRKYLSNLGLIMSYVAKHAISKINEVVSAWHALA